MTRIAGVALQWFVDSSIGSPRGNLFSLPARFSNQGEEWTEEAWSLVVESIEKPDITGYQNVTVHFLMSNAPHQWLEKGRRFKLYEGNLIVAEGKVK